MIMKPPEFFTNPFRIPYKTCICGISYLDEPKSFKLHMRHPKHVEYCSKYLFK